MLKRRLFTLLVLSAVSLFASPASQVLATPATPGFHAAVAMPNSSNGSEPSLAISIDGIRYVSWQSPGKFAGSSDGVNFAALATPDTGASGDVRTPSATRGRCITVRSVARDHSAQLHLSQPRRRETLDDAEHPR